MYKRNRCDSEHSGQCGSVSGVWVRSEVFEKDKRVKRLYTPKVSSSRSWCAQTYPCTLELKSSAHAGSKMTLKPPVPEEECVPPAHNRVQPVFESI